MEAIRESMPEQMAFPFEAVSKFNIGDKCCHGKKIGIIQAKEKHRQNPDIWVYYLVAEEDTKDWPMRIWYEESELKKIT